MEYGRTNRSYSLEKNSYDPHIFALHKSLNKKANNYSAKKRNFQYNQ